MLKGARRARTTSMHCKSPPTVQNLVLVYEWLVRSECLNNLLFELQLNMGFLGLLHLGEMVDVDSAIHRNW